MRLDCVSCGGCRGSEDPMLEHTDGSEMCISLMTVILVLLVWLQPVGKGPNCSAETGLAVQLLTWFSSADS